MEPEHIKLDSIDRYNTLYGLPTLHPLVTVADMSEAASIPDHIRLEYGIYAVFLKNGVCCSLKYGRKSYDYQEGSIVSFAPGQIIDVEMIEGERPVSAIGLLFHPDLIYGTPLGEKISGFGFFDYTQTEALHLSLDERCIITDCLDKISREIKQPCDSHSSSVLSANILLLLEYLHRFYDRQFVTRHKVNSDIVAQFERRLKEHFAFDRRHDCLPSVSDFASDANLSPKYFSDLVKRETGLTPKTMIDRQMISAACHRLAASSDDIAIIAYDLGFQYPAHFTRAFKRLTGQSPTDYRRMTFFQD
ncbi:MAG: AraC family transcriptional regulator [Muribaculaceae bacterium]|nr:AraC family transcriptional regulator [Muribaculaceae bacterium]